MVNRVVRSTSVPIADRFSPMMSWASPLPLGWTGTSRRVLELVAADTFLGGRTKGCPSLLLSCLPCGLAPRIHRSNPATRFFSFRIIDYRNEFFVELLIHAEDRSNIV